MMDQMVLELILLVGYSVCSATNGWQIVGLSTVLLAAHVA
jgi:hypothetical protein